MSMDMNVFSEKIEGIVREIRKLFGQLEDIVTMNETLRSENIELKAELRDAKAEAIGVTRKLKKVSKTLGFETA